MKWWRLDAPPFCSPRTVLVGQTELFCGGATGADPPEIDRQLAGESDDGFFACGAGEEHSVGDLGFPFLNRFVVGLEADQAPGKLD